MEARINDSKGINPITRNAKNVAVAVLNSFVLYRDISFLDFVER